MKLLSMSLVCAVILSLVFGWVRSNLFMEPADAFILGFAFGCVHFGIVSHLARKEKQ